jgi:hypothetical protein
MCDFLYRRDANTENTFENEFNQKIQSIILDQKDYACFIMDNLLV